MRAVNRYALVFGFCLALAFGANEIANVCSVPPAVSGLVLMPLGFYIGRLVRRWT